MIVRPIAPLSGPEGILSGVPYGLRATMLKGVGIALQSAMVYDPADAVSPFREKEGASAELSASHSG